MWLYATLMISTISVPLALSFDRKLQFFRQWRYLFPAMLIVALSYIAVDILFTHWGVWGFNARYHSALTMLGLPLEEWLFFLAVPYASIFLHDSLMLYFPWLRLSKKTANTMTGLLIATTITVLAINAGKTYTTYASILLAVVLLTSLFDSSGSVHSFYLTFLVILLPFVAVNGILTGSFIQEPVVWYNDAENLGIRLFTIPVEDFAYGFSLILFNLMLRAKIQTTGAKKHRRTNVRNHKETHQYSSRYKEKSLTFKS